jgi:signal transduction histidine kinase
VDAFRRMSVLHRVARLALAETSLPTLVDAALSGLAELVPGWRHAFGIIDDAQGVYVAYDSIGPGGSGVPAGLATPLALFPGDLERLRRGEIDQADAPAPAGAPRRAQLIAPALDQGSLVGTVQITRESDTPFDVAEASLALELGSILATALRQIRLRQELVRAHDEAMAGLRAKDAFLAQASHELRSPLDAMLGYIGLLADTPDDGLIRDARPDIDGASKAALHLRALVDDLLDLSRAEGGQQAVTLQPVHLPALLRELDATAAPLVARRGNRWAWTCPADAFVNADPLRLRQVLLNLVGNAARFTANGAVDLRVEAAVGGWSIDVRDNGIGIAAEQLPTLFDPFTQAHDPRAGYGGTGLGLAIADRYVRRMGGRIRVNSALGEGSSFRVVLNAA